MGLAVCERGERMKVKEVFCEECYRWKKREDLVEALNRGGELYCAECGAVLIRTDEYNRMKRYQVVGFEDTGPVFWFTAMAKNFSEALMTFYKLEIREVEND